MRWTRVIWSRSCQQDPHIFAYSAAREKLSQPLRCFDKNSRYWTRTIHSKNLFRREKDQNSLDIRTFLPTLSDAEKTLATSTLFWQKFKILDKNNSQQKLIQEQKRSKQLGHPHIFVNFVRLSQPLRWLVPIMTKSYATGKETKKLGHPHIFADFVRLGNSSRNLFVVLAIIFNMWDRNYS